MKKTFYIVAIFIVFIFMIVFFGQNVANTNLAQGMIFLWMIFSFSSGFFFLVTLGMIQGIMILLLIQKIIKDARNQEPEKLSL